MAIHRVTLKELREIVLDIIKEEKEIKKDPTYYSVINQLKKKMTQKEAEKLVNEKQDDYNKYIKDFKDEKGKVNSFKVALNLIENK